MRTLLLALKNKVRDNATLWAKFGSRVYIIDNESDPGMIDSVGEFPFIGIRDGEVLREHNQSGQVYEALRPTFWIYQDLNRGPQDNIISDDGLLALSALLITELEYDVDLAAAGYTGGQIIESFCIRIGGTEQFATAQHPTASRLSVQFEYTRDTEVTI